MQYSALTTPQGTFVDDVLTYRLADEHFMLVVNASNIIKDFDWIAEQIAGLGDAVAVNTSSRYALIALQGPAARDVLQTLTGVDLADDQVLLVHDRRGGGRPRHDLAHRLHRRGRLRGLRAARLGRAGVGRDPPGGQERRRRARRARRARHAAARSGDAPVRQRHRRDDHRARSGPRLDRRLEEGRVPRARRAPAAEGRGAAPRSSSASRCSTARSRVTATTSTSTASKAGVVTSGTQTPFLKKAIGMAYVPVDRTAPGTEFEVDIRGRRARGRVVPMPFYKRAK